MATTDNVNLRFFFSVTGYPASGSGAAPVFDVVDLDGIEAIARPFRFTLTLATRSESVDLGKMLAATMATLKIRGPNATDDVAPYYGVLESFEYLYRVSPSGGEPLYLYRAVLVPRLWMMSWFRVSQVHTAKKSIPDLIQSVLTGQPNVLTSNDVDVQLLDATKYRTHDFVCQFEESLLDFASRWMEKEGLYYYFDHAENTTGPEKLIIVDDSSKLSSTVKNVTFVEDSRDTNGPTSVYSFICRQERLPNTLTLKNYNYRSADMSLQSQIPVSDSGLGNVSLYGENAETTDEITRYATLRAQEILCRGTTFTAESSVVGVRSGYFIQMSHPVATFNGKQYLVTEIRHQGTQSNTILEGAGQSGANGSSIRYTNTFQAIPKTWSTAPNSQIAAGQAVQFRAARTTRRPTVSGMMSAVVDSDASSTQYADLDEYGQYRVQMPFNASTMSAAQGSARVRMATPYSGMITSSYDSSTTIMPTASGTTGSGSGTPSATNSNIYYGIDFPLHKGAEVLLSFMGGDPDQPVIMSAAPNSINQSVVTSANNTISAIKTPGGNQLVFQDNPNPGTAAGVSPAGITAYTPFGSAAGTALVVAAQGIIASTSGSSTSFTAGASTSFTLGTKNSINLTAENTLAASVTTKFTLGYNVAYSASSDVTWKVGKGITLDDSYESVNLKAKAKLKGNEGTEISGGQLTPISAAVETTKKALRAALVTNIAVNTAVMSASGAKFIKDSDKKGGKGALNSDINKGLASIMSGSTAVTAAAATLAVNIAAAGIKKACDPDAVYVSNIYLKDSKTRLIVDKVGAGFIDLEPDAAALLGGRITMTAGLKSIPSLNPLQATSPYYNTAAPASTTLTLDATHITAKVGNPLGEVSLEHPGGNLVKVSAASIEASAAAGVAKMTLQAASSKIEAGPTASLELTAQSSTLKNGTTSAQLQPAAATITTAAGQAKLMLNAWNSVLISPGSKLTLSPAGAKVNGALIQLG